VPGRVFVDATAIPAERGGVGRYVDDLLPARNLNDLTKVGRLLAELSGTRPVRRAPPAPSSRPPEPRR